ncbi:MAG TPA: pyridoxamine 5'-phosphate oxidase family protein [Candidatus Dormibacteraeota bacterium]|nr:pyridoxamine 5'-phosphate oxidase family protein [Candidatus Dormibacteraeota bacterium]
MNISMGTAGVEEVGLPGDEMLRRRFRTPDIPVETSLSEVVVHYIESLDFFFIATSNRMGECDSSYRGKGKGVPAVKILDSRTIIFPHYMGNGTFRSLGNILENPQIGMLFINLGTGLRMRINGRAEISENPEWLKLFPHSLLIVKVTVQEAYEQNRPVGNLRQ